MYKRQQEDEEGIKKMKELVENGFKRPKKGLNGEEDDDGKWKTRRTQERGDDSESESDSDDLRNLRPEEEFDVGQGLEAMMKAEEEMMERDQDYAGGRGEMMGRPLPSITLTNGCSKCPKSAGPERCQYCSPENFCCVPEHGNSSSVMTDKVMCPKCSPNNFCRDPKHGNSEDNPAHKSSCRKCSHDYFNNVSNEQVSGREGGNVGYQRVGYQYRGRCGKCGKPVTKSYKFCFHCNKERNPYSETKRQRSDEFGINIAGSQPSSTHFRSSGGERLSATKLAEHFSSTRNKVSAQKMNKIIEEIGWSRSFSGGGYEPTKQGLRKDVLRLESQKGTPYCSYPPGIIHDIALISRFADISPASAGFSNVSPIQTQSSQGNSGDCVCYCGKCSLLGKSQKYKTRDGHFVRSRGEVMIDNYLYTSRVAHAYELDLILTDSERMSPDFTVLTPNGNVYIELWGLEGQSDYDKNTEKKKRLYEKHDLSLINVRPDDLDNLDSILSQKLARYGVRTAF